MAIRYVHAVRMRGTSQSGQKSREAMGLSVDSGLHFFRSSSPLSLCLSPAIAVARALRNHGLPFRRRRLRQAEARGREGRGVGRQEKQGVFHTDLITFLLH